MTKTNTKPVTVESAKKANTKPVTVESAEAVKAEKLAQEKAVKAEKLAQEKAAKAEKLAQEKAAKAAEAEQKKAAKEAAAKAKQEAAEAEKAEKAKLEAEAATKREEALKKVEAITEELVAAEAEVKRIKDELHEAKKAARIPVAGSGSTAVLRQKAAGYVKDKEHKTESGNASVHCNDETAQKLLGKTLDECYSIAAEISEESEEALRAKYAHLNAGMQRMNLGNKIRGVLNAK